MAAIWCLQAYQRQGGGDEESGCPDEDRLHWMYRRGTDLLRSRREADRSGQLGLEERELAVSDSCGQCGKMCALRYLQAMARYAQQAVAQGFETYAESAFQGSPDLGAALGM